jgi:hypothetical protein
LLFVGIAIVVLMHAPLTSADTPPDATTSSGTPSEESATETPEETAAWSFSATAATYIVPLPVCRRGSGIALEAGGTHCTRVYEQPTLAVDYDWLHLEGRYNYEALESGSLWLGYNFSVGETITLDCTPMVGGVFGDVTGVAPGGTLTLAYWKLDLYTEAEYFFDTEDHTGNFAYAWSELGLAPLEWIRFGLVGQRTNAYDAEVDIQRGLFAGVTYRWLGFTTYVFDIDQDRQTWVLSLAASF